MKYPRRMSLDPKKRFYSTEEEVMWGGLEKAVKRRDLFWILFYTDSLIHSYHVRKASMLIE